MKNIIFIGTNFFAAQILEKMIKHKFNITYIITKDDLIKGRNRKKIPTPVKNIGLKYNIKTLSIKTINEKKIENFLIKVKPTLCVMTEYFEKININIIKIPQNGIINIHPSILPDFRGASPIQYAILKKKKETGVSIIKINDNIDAGDIICVKKCKINKEETYKSLFKKLITLGFKGVKHSINMIKKKKDLIKKQNNNNVTYAPKIDKNFYKIQWADSADLIERKIRATDGFSKHYTFIKNIHLKIIKVKYLKKYKFLKINPGTIIKITNIGIDITTGNGIIRIKKIQFENKNIISIKDMLNSKKNLFKIGDIFN